MKRTQSNPQTPKAQGFFVASHLSEPFTTEKTRLEWVQKQFASVPRSQDVHFLSGNLWDHLQSLLKDLNMGYRWIPLDAVPSISGALDGNVHHYSCEIGLEPSAGTAESDLAAYRRRLKLVQAIYEDRGQRRPELPWEDDAYRRCQYQADYEALRYTGFASFRTPRRLAPALASQEAERAHILSIATEYRQEAVILQRSAKLLGYRFQFCGFRVVPAMFSRVFLKRKGLEGLSTKYGPTVRSLKRHCKTLTDASIYRQRLLFQNEELDDDQTLAHLTAELAIGAFLELQLVLVPWQALDHPDLFKNYEKLKEAISEGSSQEADPNYLCRLDTAVNNRQLEIVRLLLEARAHPDGGRAASQDSGQDSPQWDRREEGSAYSGERHGNTPLCTAISQRDLPMIKLLLQSGCKKDHIYEDGSTALMSACEQNCDEVVKTLLQAGNGRNQVVQYLLRSRAEVDAADCRCRSPLWVAARNGHLPVVKTLVAAGARVFKFFKDDEVSFIPRPRPTASRSTVIKSQTKGRSSKNSSVRAGRIREKWVGWGTKLVQYRKALQLGLETGRIAANDPVLLIDGWDCVLVGPASEFIEKLSMAPFTNGPQPWYAGERICGPDFFKANRIDAVYPDPGTPWRYPNAGDFTTFHSCMTGRAEPVLKLIEDLLDGAGDGDTFPEDGDDQGRLHEHLLELGKKLMDWSDATGSCHTLLIQSVASFSVSTKQSHSLWELESPSPTELLPRLRNLQTGQRPIVLHGNGHTGRWFMCNLWREMDFLRRVGLTPAELAHLPHDGPVAPGTAPCGIERTQQILVSQRPNSMRDGSDRCRTRWSGTECGDPTGKPSSPAMPMKKFRMTNTELKLKRERMMEAFRAGKSALEDLRLPYFLAYGSAMAALREGQFQPYEDDIHVGIYAWDLASLQRQCTECTAKERDNLLKNTFDRFGFEPVQEIVENAVQAAAGQEAKQNQAVLVCPRYYIAEGWSDEMAFPILYKFTHRDSFVRFDVMVFAMQFGQLWDFADGGAETSSGWRYSPFSPQLVEFDKIMTYTMPAQPLEEHYGPEWYVPKVYNYVQSLTRCKNRCQVLRVLPFDPRMRRFAELPAALSWEEFRPLMRQYRMQYAKSMADSEYEFPEKKLDLYKLESKPIVLFQAANMCKDEGNVRLKDGKASAALGKYEEGLYIVDKCREVLLTWRLIFRQIHDEKAEKDRKDRGLKVADLLEPDMPREFRSDEDEERALRLALQLNAAQAALQCQQWDAVELHTTAALQLEPQNRKALYRRGLARNTSGDMEGSKADFWALLKASHFDSKEAISQLMKMMPKEDVQRQFKRMQKEAEKEEKIGTMLKDIDEDERIGQQDERALLMAFISPLTPHFWRFPEPSSEQESRLDKQRQSLAAAEAAVAAAEKRLETMVSVEEVQRCEKEARAYREALVSVDKEARQLRLALAEALSSGTDLSMAKRELQVLRDAQEAASQRVQALESVNEQLEKRIAQVEAEIATLKKGTVDLRSEEDLMREVIVSQSEQLLRRVEDLTAEEQLAAEDRRQLLATAAQLAAEVEKAEARVARQAELEDQCNQLDAAQQTLSAEVERLRRTNDALCQQVLGPDGEGPFAGALQQVSVLDGEEDQSIRDEIGRLVRGQLLLTSQAGSVKGDAAALALRLQQLLAEREEAFWVERQRLSDHITSLERTHNGRTSNLLRHYDAAVRAAAEPASGSGLVTGGLRRLRQTIGA
eukprot:s2626_g3.t2